MGVMVSERVQQIIADLLGVSLADITPQSSPENVEFWDSVRQVNLVVALEQEFNLAFEPEEIDEMKSVGKITALLESKLKQV
jgi:acyl carrier protein